MTEQPTARRLAHALDAEIERTVAIDMLHHTAAAELRRLHAEVETLREANEAFGKRQAWWTERMFDLEQQVERDDVLLRQALAFTMRPFATVRDFEAARAVLRDAIRTCLGETK